ncbi:hypothetical protein Taro_011034, partial [Colocasia esculenta]|nr:hypothetical protein [Colocasia esculenta]
SNHRFTRRSDEARSQLVWTTTARSNFKHLLYNATKNAQSFSECRPDSFEGVRTDMDEERLLGKSVQHMSHREMATNLHNNESESGCQSRSQHAYKWEKELKRPSTFQEAFDKTHKKKGTDQYISDRAREVAESYSQQMTETYVGEEEQP